jgi:hypothetical protein
MISWRPPSLIPHDHRVAPYETTVWVLDATLVKYKRQIDSDYHLVLRDSSGNTMIAEIPRPSRVGSSSPFLCGIQHARMQFDSKYTVTTTFQSANVPVRITGVGMFDSLHGHAGEAPNGIELHPVLDITFNPPTRQHCQPRLTETLPHRAKQPKEDQYAKKCPPHFINSFIESSSFISSANKRKLRGIDTGD